jgi:hypothetical protein
MVYVLAHVVDLIVEFLDAGNNVRIGVSDLDAITRYGLGRQEHEGNDQRLGPRQDFTIDGRVWNV